MKNANIGIIPLKLLHWWIDKWIDKSWLVRATTNGIVGFLVGPVLGYTIFAFAVLAAIPFQGLSPGDAIIFCVKFT